MKIPPFLIELVQRTFSGKPKFFLYLQQFSLAVSVVAFLPDLLTFLEIPSPTWLGLLHNTAVKVGSLVAVFIAQLPVKPLNDKV